jgi:hypothetical protein
VTNSLFVVVNTIDKRTGAQKLFNNVNATGIPLHSEHEWRWIVLAGQTSIDVD